MHLLQNQLGLHCDTPDDRHLISSAENSSVTQCSLKQLCCLPHCANYEQDAEIFSQQRHRIQGVKAKTSRVTL